MSESTIPTILSSLLLGMIVYKVYSNENSKIERFVNMPLSVQPAKTISYSTERGGYNPKDEANKFYSLKTMPTQKSLPELENIPLPEPADGSIPPSTHFYDVKRVVDVSMQDRLQGQGDVIRGDLEIPVKPISDMFNYVTIRESATRGGILDFGTKKSKNQVQTFLYDKSN